MLQRKAFCDFSIINVEYFKAIGGHVGHLVKDWDPQIIGVLNFLVARTSYLQFDLFFLVYFIQKGFLFLKQNSYRGAIVLYVDSHNIGLNFVRNLAISARISFINTLWVGGLLSNFRETIFKFVRKKKVNSKIMSKKKRDGVVGLDFLPEVVLTTSEYYASFCISECNNLLIPTISVVDSNVRSVESTFPVFLNDDSILTARALFYIWNTSYWFGRADFALHYLNVTHFLFLTKLKIKINFFLTHNLVFKNLLNKKILFWLSRARARKLVLSLNLFLRTPSL